MRILTMITVVIYQHNFTYQMLRTAIEHADYGTQKRGACLVVERDDDARLGQILAILFRTTPATGASKTQRQINK